jgi:hypothetical protein
MGIESKWCENDMTLSHQVDVDELALLMSEVCQ